MFSFGQQDPDLSQDLLAELLNTSLADIRANGDLIYWGLQL